ncbi:MAG: glycosyltransferase family 2 protein [Clostridiales bacterium]|jgi:glycosyltransferase involved in cell wall biosynthesis|nr:glycosyltransferase family 2 protein [Clostridiales bacterium]
MSLVSIVMATYNGEKYIAEQIDSILASTYRDIELFIYDDGSKDSTLSILKDYECRYPDRIHVHQNKENQGVTLNFLNAITRTTTDYVMLCDQDDVWKPDKIAATLKRMRNMEVQLGKELPLAVFTDAEVVDSNLRTLEPSFFKTSHLDPRRTDLAHLLMENKLIGCTTMINASLRKVLQGHRLPKNAKFHDWWIALIAASLGKIGFLKQSTLLYRQHGNNVVGNLSFMNYIKDRISSLRKQKEALLILYRQAEEFLAIYGERLSKEQRLILEQFINLHHYNFLKRRVVMIKYGYLKTGIVRNLGLMLLA